MGLKYKINMPLDVPERTLLHKEIILSKPFLKNLYIEWYGTFINEFNKLPPGKIVELGSGGGFLKELMPTIISSDIIPLPTNDLTFSALSMPFDDDSISGLFMVDTFHHLPDASLFLSEADRVLKENGKLIMIEPANSLWGRLIFSNLHHEPFNPKGNWQIPDSGPLSGANISLPWIVFVRDKAIFNKEFPKLGIEEITFHTPLRYLLSGGVSFKQFVPDISFPFFRRIDNFLVSLSKHLSMFMTIKIKKTNF
jgi:Methylase involved in ubiquinone/menaquinone biosynthesis